MASTSEGEVNLCEICCIDLAKYCCPKCSILYCSLNCYQANSHLQCSEYFYKDSVLNEISIRKNKDSKAKILEVLKKTHEHEETFNSELNNVEFDKLDSDDERYQDISERLSGINLDDAGQVWEKLTDDERQEFIAFLKSDDVTKLIPLWKPWWIYYKEDMVENMTDNESFKKNCPKICAIKNMSAVTTKAPSECVQYNLINIISAYAFTMRYFNGEHFDFAGEAVSCAISLSLTLKAAENFNDIETAIKSVEQECINSNWITSDEDNFKIMRDDLQRILKGPTKFENKFYILCALSDFQKLLSDSLKPPQKDNSVKCSKIFPNDYFPTVGMETSSTIKMCQKKIDYYLSFTKDCYH